MWFMLSNLKGTAQSCVEGRTKLSKETKRWKARDAGSVETSIGHMFWPRGSWTGLKLAESAFQVALKNLYRFTATTAPGCRK